MSDTDAEQQQLFEAAVREHVRGLSASDFLTFVAETRPPDEARPGDAGRAAAARRFATAANPETPGAPTHTSPGANGRAAARSRFPSTSEKKD